ncbi:MAG TPA: FecR domain-containing protein [Xanthomonadaceae bacterium]|nr:FecR domain-containing protein [Xanthomonadaceae bacterium]
MSMHDTDHRDDSPHEAAARWHLRLRDEPGSVETERALAAWLDADVAHRLAYADVCAAGFACEQVFASDPHAALRHGEPVFGGPPRPLRQPATATSRRRRRAMFAVALAASVVIAMLVPGISLSLRADHIGQPGLVQQHTLEDGSVLSLDGASAVRVRYQGDARRVDVLRGAVHVDVRPDPARPFVVRSGDLEAQALGTRYAVALETRLHRVTVDAGRVAVRMGDGEAVELSAGRMLTAPLTGGGFRLDESGMAASSWVSGQLVFSATPFEDAVAAMARHLPERVVLTRTTAADPVTAVAPVAEARQLLERLGHERGVRSTRIPGLLIVLY